MSNALAANFEPPRPKPMEDDPIAELVMPAMAPVDPPTAETPREQVLDYSSIPTAAVHEAAVGPSIRSKAIRSSFWTVFGFGSSQIIRFGSNLVLSRLLIPDHFGLAALVGMIIAGLQQFSDVGLGPSIIQNPRGDDEAFLNTAWTISILRGLIIWAVASAIAWPMSKFYGQSILVPIFLVGAWNAVLNGFNSTSLFTLNRHMSLGKITLLNCGTQVCSTVTMIAIACVKPGVWAIVFGGLTGSIVTMAASHFLIPGKRNRLAWDPAARKELFSPFAGWILLSTMITFFANESDRLLLAKMVPMAVVGIYYTALTLVRLPTEMISRLAAMTVFPALAHAATEKGDALRDRVYRARNLILPAGVAGILGLSLGAPIFFGVLYTRKWTDAGWMAQFMAVGAWATILQLTADRTLLALGRTRPLAISNFANVSITVLGALVGNYIGEHHFNHHGIPGFILGVAAGNFAGHAVIQFALFRSKLGIYKQDVTYTLILMALAAIGLTLPRLLMHVAPASSGKAVSILSALAVTGGAGAWAGFRVLRWMKVKAR